MITVPKISISHKNCNEFCSAVKRQNQKITVSQFVLFQEIFLQNNFEEKSLLWSLKDMEYLFQNITLYKTWFSQQFHIKLSYVSYKWQLILFQTFEFLLDILFTVVFNKTVLQWEMKDRKQLNQSLRLSSTRSSCIDQNYVAM